MLQHISETLQYFSTFYIIFRQHFAKCYNIFGTNIFTSILESFSGGGAGGRLAHGAHDSWLAASHGGGERRPGLRQPGRVATRAESTVGAW
jgi:hypothetical protein